MLHRIKTFFVSLFTTKKEKATQLSPKEKWEARRKENMDQFKKDVLSGESCYFGPLPDSL
jgi:hypothetical protein